MHAVSGANLQASAPMWVRKQQETQESKQQTYFSVIWYDSFSCSVERRVVTRSYVISVRTAWARCRDREGIRKASAKPPIRRTRETNLCWQLGQRLLHSPLFRLLPRLRQQPATAGRRLLLDGVQEYPPNGCLTRGANPASQAHLIGGAICTHTNEFIAICNI